ncbi:glycoside hydrolase family 5 protein, partial [Piromyces sp. E2]
ITTLTFIIIGVRAMRDISSKELVSELKIGWNLGNTLDAYCYDYIDYSKDQTASETCWGNARATQELYNKLSENGFNTFRIPITWTGHFGGAPDYKINGVWMKRVHEVVDYALNTKNGYAIIDLHHENWNHAFTKNLETAKVIIKSLWSQIAKEFENSDEHLIFECMNEPRKVGSDIEWGGGDEESWAFINELNSICINTIRSSGGNNPLRHIMIPTYAASFNETAIQNLNYPSNDNKIIVSIHSYSPYGFALDQSDSAYSNFNTTGEYDIDNVMKTIKTNLISKNIPVIIGEFGSVDRNNYVDRVNWAKYYVKRAKANSIPCILWDNGKFINDDGERFGFINRSTYELEYPYMMYALLCGSGRTK